MLAHNPGSVTNLSPRILFATRRSIRRHCSTEQPAGTSKGRLFFCAVVERTRGRDGGVPEPTIVGRALVFRFFGSSIFHLATGYWPRATDLPCGFPQFCEIGHFSRPVF